VGSTTVYTYEKEDPVTTPDVVAPSVNVPVGCPGPAEVPSLSLVLSKPEAAPDG